MKASEYHIGFVGFGHMAQIIFQAIDHAKLIPRSQISFIRRDPEKMRQDEQRFGITWINSWFLRDLRTAFGGSKQSGIGREGGVHSLEFYTETRNICVKL